jgi:hypothetical protein
MMKRNTKITAAAAAAISLFTVGTMTPKNVPMAEGALTRNTPVYTVPVYQDVEVKTGDMVVNVVHRRGLISLFGRLKTRLYRSGNIYIQWYGTAAPLHERTHGPEGESQERCKAYHQGIILQQEVRYDWKRRTLFFKSSGFWSCL